MPFWFFAFKFYAYQYRAKKSPGAGPGLLKSDLKKNKLSGAR